MRRRLGAARQSGHEWKKAREAGGKESLRSSGPAGPKPRLDQSSQRQLVDAVLEGPQAASYATDVWTLSRVRALITKLSGEVYEPTHVRRLLRSLGFSCQHLERDEPKIAHWKRMEWPAITKGSSGELAGCEWFEGKFAEVKEYGCAVIGEVAKAAGSGF